MSFRQNNKKPDLAWRKSVRLQLLATGLPDLVVSDERRWTYVLLHGDDLESGWSPAWITKDQAADLLRLLESHYEQSSALWLFESLKKRIDNKLHA
jgi:hypothetical protein